MPDTKREPMGWGTIIAVMIATGLIVGLTLGALREVLGFEGGTAGVGASMGIVGALLIARRGAALRQQQGS